AVFLRASGPGAIIARGRSRGWLPAVTRRGSDGPPPAPTRPLAAEPATALGDLRPDRYPVARRVDLRLARPLAQTAPARAPAARAGDLAAGRPTARPPVIIRARRAE